ncbi:MAG TPA: 1-(5-phosphoribosyl)-5-[(5-phosphoribosylamino)methylideneamino]imidazole-4-carboxamide isomerase [Alphaproteobacteria bacterium]|nr:1-(5-phosphoribosyl)-5-[(5-phosphoribosylamino)methylideneamino]imidazole-4-carboxamide isomerase [Alphaproteobacteria bacterium]
MILFPAIDLKGGACVRLLRGEMDAATTFNEDPGDQARRFVEAGCEWLHVVDLDGAFAGKAVNAPAVAIILANAKVPVQLGGGIRDEASIERWLESGIARVILGTIALRQPDFVKAACRRWPGKIVVGIDARDGFVAVEGWAKTSTVKALDLALMFEQAGVAAIVYTDISRDGAMIGPNIEATVDIAFQLTTPVIVSGGVSSLDDLKAIKQHEESGIVGVICGRALYDGRIDLGQAVKLLRG